MMTNAFDSRDTSIRNSICILTKNFGFGDNIKRGDYMTVAKKWIHTLLLTTFFCVLFATIAQAAPENNVLNELVLKDKQTAIYTVTLDKANKLYSSGESIGYDLKIATNKAEYSLNVKAISKTTGRTYYEKKHTITQSERISFTIQRNDVYAFTCELYKGNVQISTQSIDFAVAPKNKPAKEGNFYYGLEARLNRPYDWGASSYVENLTAEQSYNLLWSYIDHMGVNLIRGGGSPWDAVQRVSAAQSDFATMDKVLNDVSKRNIAFDWVLISTPKWASTQPASPDVWSTVPQTNAWKSYLSTIAKRYSKYSDLIIYELWNEPNWKSFWQGSAADYTNLASVGIDAIKGQDANAKIINGGMVPRWAQSSDFVTPDDSVFYQFYQEKLQAKKLYGIAWHGHGNFEDHRYIYSKIENYVSLKGLFINEAGTDFDSQNQTAQAASEVRKILYALSKEQKMYVLYQLGAIKSEDESKYIVSRKGEPRAALVAYSALINQLPSPNIDEVIAEDDGIYVYGFRSGSKYVVTVFGDAAKEHSFKVNQYAPNFSVYDMFGNAVSVPSNREFKIKKADDIFYFVFGTPVDNNYFSIDGNNSGSYIEPPAEGNVTNLPSEKPAPGCTLLIHYWDGKDEDSITALITKDAQNLSQYKGKYWCIKDEGYDFEGFKNAFKVAKEPDLYYIVDERPGAVIPNEGYLQRINELKPLAETAYVIEYWDGSNPFTTLLISRNVPNTNGMKGYFWRVREKTYNFDDHIARFKIEKQKANIPYQIIDERNQW